MSRRSRIPLLLAALLLLFASAGPAAAHCTGRCDYNEQTGCLYCRFTILRGFGCITTDCSFCQELECSATPPGQPPAGELAQAAPSAPSTPRPAARVVRLPARI